MPKSFQKTAKNIQELHPPHPGIINSVEFHKHFDLHCYKPSADLQPFVTHIWIQRRKQVPEPYQPSIEIASGAHIYAFFSPKSAFIRGITRHKLRYDPQTANVIAGIKFQPGGFYPFLKRSISTINDPLPVQSVFPAVNKSFTHNLLTQSDPMIVREIEMILRDRHPKTDKNLTLIAQIMDALTTNSPPQTVGATATAFNISERTLQLLFQTYVGVGVKWIISRRRLLAAIDRGQRHPYPTWAEIAAELGYSSQSHFSRDFKHATGLSPSEYSKTLK